MTMRNRARSAAVSCHEADTLCGVLQALGEYRHVSVRAERGHLNIRVDDGDPVARFTPLGPDHYGLSFRSHTGRWEPMPFVGDLAQLAHDLVTVLGPYLARPDFSDRKSGSDH